MGVLAYHFCGVSGVVYQDFLCGDYYVHGMPVGFHLEGAVGRELQQVQTGEVAGGVIEEHVLAAGIRGVDAGCVFRRVPAVYRCVVLHAGIAALPGGFGNFLEQVFGFVGVDYASVHYGPGGEIGVAHYGYHEVVGYADGVIGILEEDGAVGIGIRMRSVVTLRYERVSFGFFFTFALYEVDYVGMVDVQDNHLSGAARLASGLDYSGEGVEAFHEA